MRIRSRLTLFIAIPILAVLGCSEDEDDDDIVTPPVPARSFTVSMTGAKERPNPVSPAGNGTATFTLNEAETTLTYSISVSNMSSAITASHIHLGNASTAGGVIIALTTPSNGGTVSGTITTSSSLSLGLSFVSLIGLIRNGDTYVNVHTANNANGEIRGQIEIAP